MFNYQSLTERYLNIWQPLNQEPGHVRSRRPSGWKACSIREASRRECQGLSLTDQVVSVRDRRPNVFNRREIALT